MASDAQFQNFEQISAKLRQLCIDGSTGTFSLATDENHHATISLKEGRVVGAAYRQFKGESAIDKIVQISAAKCSFAAGVLRSTATDASLAGCDKLMDLPEPRPASTADQTPSTGSDSTKIRETIEAEATEFLGPMATTICAEHCAAVGNLDSAENLHLVLDRIAEEVGDAAKGRQFKQSALNRLK